MKSRLGRFYLPTRFVRTHPEAVADLTEGMAVVRAECLYERDVIEYTALSPLFDELSQGARAPVYGITCDLSGEVVAVRHQ